MFQVSSGFWTSQLAPISAAFKEDKKKGFPNCQGSLDDQHQTDALSRDCSTCVVEQRYYFTQNWALPYS